jgi:peptidoglycan/LPS O-acetylase OafA/YrhL
VSQIQGRIAGIDSLRAIAVLAVIIYHIRESILPGGFVGVDIFFVISGYVVCKSLLHTRWNSVSDFLSQFYIRRIIRILPALLFMLLLTAVVSRMFIPNSWGAASSIKTGKSALVGLSNFHLVYDTDGYFSVNSDFNPFLHTWSLAVEEQFYIFFPLLFLLQHYLCRKSNSRIKKIAGILLFPSLLLSSLIICESETIQSQSRSYFLLPSRFWELAAGVILCQCQDAGYCRPRNKILSTAILFSGILLIFISIFLAIESRFPFPWALAPVSGTLLYITGITQTSNSKLFDNAIMAFVGRISYSLYLWHWPVVVIMRWTTGIQSPVQLMAAFILTAVIGFASWHFIEMPFQKLRSRQDDLVSFESPRIRGLFPLEINFVNREISYRTVIMVSGLMIVILSNIIYDNISSSLWLPQSITMERDLTKNPWRFATKPTNRQLLPGDSGRAWSNRRMFIIGDSHAGSYVRIIDLLRREKGVSVYLFTKAGVNLGNMIHPQSPADKALQISLLEEIQSLARPGDSIMLASLKVLRLATQWGSLDLQQVIDFRESPGFEDARRLAVADTLSLVQSLHKLGLKVIIEGPKPVYRVPPYRFSDWFNRNHPDAIAGFTLTRDFLEVHCNKAWKSIQEIQNIEPGITVWDPFSVLCRGETCSAFDEDKPLFFDADHLTPYGNEKLFPSLVEILAKLWNKSTTSKTDNETATLNDSKSTK